MSDWKLRIEQLLADEKANTKEKYLRSVLRQGERCNWHGVPSPAQEFILARMYNKYEMRRVAAILGE